MKEAGINEATLGVFPGLCMSPEREFLIFNWLVQIMDNLYKNGIHTILATPSGARPVWLDNKYPEVMRVDANGNRNRHGGRHNHCMSSEKYREKVRIIDGKLAEAVGNHPGLIMWHIFFMAGSSNLWYFHFLETMLCFIIVRCKEKQEGRSGSFRSCGILRMQRIRRSGIGSWKGKLQASRRPC